MDINDVPEKVLDLFETIDESKNGYTELARVLKESEVLGWTFDYGLDAEPFDFKPI